MGLADELLDDARFLRDKGIAEQRQTLMRRCISTAYYAVFHLFVGDFVEHWEFPDQRARLGRMFLHSKMSSGFAPKAKKLLTPPEQAPQNIIRDFSQLQKERERADYDTGWTLVETDVNRAVEQAEDVFSQWREIKNEDFARRHLLSMFGARLD
ncbi:MAG: hypothetical protein K2X35_08825 [Bryobacteraceae bacterium]|nr:hypothetical protein [Bryobacteraceae bacterium]